MTPDEKAHYYGRMEKNFPQFLKAMERLSLIHISEPTRRS